jgi:hypothetical protein
VDISHVTSHCLTLLLIEEVIDGLSGSASLRSLPPVATRNITILTVIAWVIMISINARLYIAKLNSSLLLTSRNTWSCSGFYKKLRNSESKLWHYIKKIIICKGFYPRRKSPRYSLDRRLGRPQNRSGRCGEEKHFSPAWNPTPAVQPVARRDSTDTRVIRMECTPLHNYYSL